MTPKEIYKIWAPKNVKWVEWVRPVLFVGLNHIKETPEFLNYTVPKIYYDASLAKDTAIILDIEGTCSIKEGIALTTYGYRPIPVFNGTDAPCNAEAIIDNETMKKLLIWSAQKLKNVSLAKDAPPVFLLDKNRLNRYRRNLSIFDNSWDIYHQDLPTAHYFLTNHITKIIVRSNDISKDLQKILFEYQKEKMKIYLTNGYEEPVEIKIKKPKKEK